MVTALFIKVLGAPSGMRTWMRPRNESVFSNSPPSIEVICWTSETSIKYCSPAMPDRLIVRRSWEGDHVSERICKSRLAEPRLGRLESYETAKSFCTENCKVRGV